MFQVRDGEEKRLRGRQLMLVIPKQRLDIRRYSFATWILSAVYCNCLQNNEMEAKSVNSCNNRIDGNIENV